MKYCSVLLSFMVKNLERLERASCRNRNRTKVHIQNTALNSSSWQLDDREVKHIHCRQFFQSGPCHGSQVRNDAQLSWCPTAADFSTLRGYFPKERMCCSDTSFNVTCFIYLIMTQDLNMQAGLSTMPSQISVPHSCRAPLQQGMTRFSHAEAMPC